MRFVSLQVISVSHNVTFACSTRRSLLSVCSSSPRAGTTNSSANTKKLGGKMHYVNIGNLQALSLPPNRWAKRELKWQPRGSTWVAKFKTLRGGSGRQLVFKCGGTPPSFARAINAWVSSVSLSFTCTPNGLPTGMNVSFRFVLFCFPTKGIDIITRLHTNASIEVTVKQNRTNHYIHDGELRPFMLAWNILHLYTFRAAGERVFSSTYDDGS